MTPSEDALRFFDGIAARYERVYALSSAESRRRMTRVLGQLPTAPARILDLGVGTGRELSALLDAGYQPTGIDVSPGMLARCARRSRPVDLVEADFWRPLPFDDSSFDSALALHGTLAHAPDLGALSHLARELARVVRPGGAWVAEAPAPAWLDEVDRASVNTGAASRDTAERRIRRTGPSTCLCEDLIAGVSVRARVFSEEEWISALRPEWTTRLEGHGELEWFLVARRV